MLAETEYTSEDGQEFWYENDLQLAAELGKTLLERNKELENQLRHTHHVQYEQAKEIDLLSKQLEVLRNVNESRMRIYEEVDRNLQDLEKTNEKLKQGQKTDKEKIKLLTDNVEVIELRCEELQNKLDKLKEAESTTKDKWRTRSVPSLTDLDLSPPRTNRHHDYLGFQLKEELWKRRRPSAEIKELRASIRNLREQHTMDQRKRSELEAEISYLYHENHNLENKIVKYERDNARIGSLESELQALEINSGKLCKNCSNKLETGSATEPDLDIEHDDLEDNISHGELVRLKNGGSAYGSRESLNTLGLETEDMSPDVFTSRDIHDIDSLQTPSREVSTLEKADSSTSILGELEDQYRRLVSKYEALVEAKSKRSHNRDVGIDTQEICPESNVVAKRPMTLSIQKEPCHNEVHFANQAQTYGRRAGLDFRSPLDPTERHFENGPPEYKRLFKEIFDTLRRSVLYEDENSDHAKEKNNN